MVIGKPRAATTGDAHLRDLEIRGRVALRPVFG
jgi:hypothetical protein